MRACRRTAAAALLIRHFPDEGAGRHDAFLALAGVFQRAGWKQDDATQFLCAMYRGLWDHEAEFDKAAKEVETTYAKAEKTADDPETGAVTGYTRLSQLINPTFLRKAFRWLDIMTKASAPTTTDDGRASGFIVNERGVFFVSPSGALRLVCMPPLEVLSVASSAQADNFGRLLRWHDVRGNEHLQVINLEHVVDSSVYRRELVDRGLMVAQKSRGRDLKADYIQFSVRNRTYG